MKKLLLPGMLLLVALAVSSASHAETHPIWKNTVSPDRVAKQKLWLLKNEERKKQLKKVDLPAHEPDARPCLATDIMGGMWKRIYFKENPEGTLHKQNKRLPHYYVSFDPDKFYGILKSPTSIDDTAQALSLMYYNKKPKTAQKYEIKEGDEKSEVFLNAGDLNIFSYRCAIVTKPSTVFLEGDMVWHGSANKGNTLLYELYRRWF